MVAVTDDPFLDDGCTGWFDGSWRTCCDVHDAAFLAGQGWPEFFEANWGLAQCVAATGGWPIAAVMLAGVTLVGAPFYWRGKRAKKVKRH